MKKVYSIVLIVLMFVVSSVPAYAMENTTEGVEVVQLDIESSDTENALTIDEIDALVEERNQAYLEGDFTAVESITDELYGNGMNAVSESELNEILGLESTMSTRNGAIFETVYTSYLYQGTTYKVMRVYATPTTSSNLYKTGVTVVSNSKTATAKAMNFIKTAVSAAAGIKSNTIGLAQSVYSAVKDVVSGLSSTSTITNIK